MTGYVDRRRLIGPALRVFLQNETGKKFGMAKLPEFLDGLPEFPYGILYPIPGSTSTSSRAYDYGDPNRCLIYIFQTTIVGVSHEQCAALSDRTYSALLEAAPGGGYAHALGLPEGLADIYRGQDAFGGIVPTDDKALYQTADTYRIEVQ